MRIRILESNQPPGQRHTHEVEIIDDGNPNITVEQSEEGENMATYRVDQDPNHPGGGHAYDPPHRSVRDDVLTEAWPANVKRTYDETGRTYLEYQDLGLADRRSGSAHTERLRVMAEQAIQNMIATNNQIQANLVSNSNAVSSNLAAQINDVNTQIARAMANGVGYDALGHAQAYAHRDLAINKQWNINETDAHAAQMFRAADEHVAGSPHSHSSPEDNLA